MARDGSLIFDTKIDNKGFKKGIDELKSIGKGSIKVANKALKATGAALGAVGVASIKVGMDFEKGMSRVSALTGATEAEFKQLEQAAKDLGRTTVFSATQASEGMSYLAMAGFKANEIIDAMPGVLNAAAAGQTELGTAADITSNILSGFSMEASESNRVADVLTKAFTSSNTSMESLGETMKYVAPIANAAGFSLEETAAAAGILGDAGIQGSQAGTTLRSAISRLVNPTGQAKKALDALGISVSDSEGKIKPLYKIIGELEDATKDMTEEQKLATISQIAGQQASSGLLAIMDAGSDTLKEFGDELENSVGEAARIAAEQLNNLDGDIMLFKSALEGAGIAIYQSFNKPLRGTVQSVTEYVGAITEAIEANASMSEIASIVGDILADVALKLAEFAPVVLKMGRETILSFIQGIMENKGALIKSAVTIASELLTTYMAIVPEMFIMGIELITGLIQGMVEEMPNLIAQAQESILTLVQSIVDNLPLFLQSGIEIILSLITGITEMLPDLITLIIDLVIDVADTLIDNLPLLVDAGIQIIFALIEGILDNLPRLIEEVPRIINSFADAIYAQFPKIIATGIQIIGKLIVGLIQAIPTLVANIPQIIAAIVNVFTLYNFAQIGKTAITKIGKGIKSMTSNIRGTAKELATKVIEMFRSMFSGSRITNIGSDLVKGIWNGIDDVTGWILDKIKGFGNSVMKGIKGIFGIKSPSTLMRDEIGKNLTLGIGVGLEKGMPELQRDAEKELSGLTKKMKATVDFETSRMGTNAVASTAMSNPQNVGGNIGTEIKRALQGFTIPNQNGNPQPLEIHLRLGRSQFVTLVEDITREQTRSELQLEGYR